MKKKIILSAGRQIFSCRIIVVQNSGRNCESIISWQGWRTQFLDLSFVHCTIFLFGMLDLRNVHFKRFICAFSFDWSILVKSNWMNIFPKMYLYCLFCPQGKTGRNGSWILMSSCWMGRFRKICIVSRIYIWKCVYLYINHTIFFNSLELELLLNLLEL